MKHPGLFILLLVWSGLGLQGRSLIQFRGIYKTKGAISSSSSIGRSARSEPQVIHVFVALCDNKYQGIVPVPAKIGNGQDPANNLYWGCAFGLKTYFKKSQEWKLIQARSVDSVRLERLVFKHVTQPVYLVADAYDGRWLQRCTEDFLNSSCGAYKDSLKIENQTIGIFGNAHLLAYIGHDGLMDFELKNRYLNRDGKERATIVLACYSKHYFSQYLKEAKVNPLVWTTGLMAPEAYTLHDAISAYVMGSGAEIIRTRAAKAYQKYQKCSEKAARNLLVSGW